MILCDSGDIVVVPFPFVDSPNAKRRPALVLSGQSFNKEHDHVLLAMITTGGKKSWKSDIPISNLGAAGIPAPSVVRMKIFTLDSRLILNKIGRLCREDVQKTKKVLKNQVLRWS